MGVSGQGGFPIGPSPLLKINKSPTGCMVLKVCNFICHFNSHSVVSNPVNMTFLDS